jgi:hypothetical protein
LRVWTPESDEDASLTLYGWRDARLVVRTVRGRKMRNTSGIDDEFSAALQFPPYYGENWAALKDCLTDLVWLPPESGYVLIVTEPLLVLDESPADLPALVRCLDAAVSAWASPVELGEWWDRPPVPFNVVLVSTADEVEAVRQRWENAGARLAQLM